MVENSPLNEKRGWCWITLLAAVSIIGVISMTSRVGQAEDDWLAQATKLIVMIEGSFEGDSTVGAGIIFGVEKDAAYIATANHVVRRANKIQDLRVKFKAQPDQLLKAQLLEQFDATLDLAVLKVEGLREHSVSLKEGEMDVLAPTGLLKRGDRVFPVGYPNGVPWGAPVAPDQVSQAVGHNISFQSTFISPGHSGGGLFEESGVLAGMIVKDAPPFGLAIDVGEIVGKLKDWGFPLGLRRPPVYAINGRWVSTDPQRPRWFNHWVDLKVEGEQVSGIIPLTHPTERHEISSSIRRDGYDIDDLKISGLIKGNGFSFNVKGSWVKRYGNSQESERVSILFTAAARGDEIRLHYQVQSPLSLEDMSGEFTVKRSRATP